MRKIYGFVAALAVAVATLGVGQSAHAAGPYWKSGADTGVRCTQVGQTIYSRSYGLTASQMVTVVAGRWTIYSIVPNTVAGGYAHYSRAHTYAQADVYRTCNRLHTTTAGHYYTYQETHYLGAPQTKCLVQSGLHVGGFPSSARYSWVGATFTGHVGSNPCPTPV